MLRQILALMLTILVLGLPASSRAEDAIAVALSLPDSDNPFALFDCSNGSICTGDAVLDVGGMKLPLTFAMEATSVDVRFSSIKCKATGWHFALMQDNGPASFPPGQTQGILWLDALGLAIEPTSRNPPGIFVTRVNVSLWRIKHDRPDTR